MKDESTLRMVHFCSKKVMYTKYHIMQEIKILMTLFDNLNHKQNVLEIATFWNPKFILIQLLDEKIE